jgi:hypothetical protein
MKFTAVQFQPEIGIITAAHIIRRTENRMMLAHHFTQGITHGGKEIVIGRQNIAVQIKFDHRQRPTDG